MEPGRKSTEAIIAYPSTENSIMTLNWQSYLAQRGARFEADQPVDFGDPASEFAALASGTVLAPLSHFGLIRATGDDAAAFLHNLLTNDVQHLGMGRAVRCGFCSPKGRLLADFLIWRENRDYLLQLSTDIQPALLRKLGMYVLRSKAGLSDANGEFALLGLAGSDVGKALETLGLSLPAAPLDVSYSPEVTLIRLDERRIELAVRAGAASVLWDRLATLARPVGTAAWRKLEIGAGVPHITSLTQDEFVPQMANLELIGGVSFTKGCYPGQEVVARTKYLGKVKRRTYRAHVEGSCPAPGIDLYSPDMQGQSCGKVIEAVALPEGGSEMLASMLMSSADAGDVRLGGIDGPRLEFRPLPYSLE